MSGLNRREWVLSSARTLSVLAGMAALAKGSPAAQSARARPIGNEPIRLALVSGSEEYHSDQSFDQFAAHLEKKFGIECHKAYHKADDDLPGLEQLAQCDAAFFFTRRLKIAGQQLQLVQQYCESGKPILGIRTASHGFQNWLAMDREVFGGNYMNHYPDGPRTKISIRPAAAKHPVLVDFKPFESVGSLYLNQGHADDIQVLMDGSIPDHQEPITWTRKHGQANVFYTSLGHPADFQEPAFIELLCRALYWSLERDYPADAAR